MFCSKGHPMTTKIPSSKPEQPTRSTLQGPAVNPKFRKALEALVSTAHQGQRSGSPLFNPSNDWLVGGMRIFQDLTPSEQKNVLKEYATITKECEVVDAVGKAAMRAGPDIAFRLDNGGLSFFSQLGVARRPDLTQYFIDGFNANRDALAFSEENQALFAEVFPYVTNYMKQCFGKGETIVQTDRRMCDAPDRSFHVRQLLFGDRYLHLPYLWRQAPWWSTCRWCR